MEEYTPGAGDQDTYYSSGGKKVPPNLVFEYRGIRHIGDPMQETYEELVQRVVEKYRRIDAGLDPVTGAPKPQRKQVNSLAAMNQAAALLHRQDPSLGSEAVRLAEENSMLKQLVQKMEAAIQALQTPQTPPAPEPEPEPHPESTEDVTVIRTEESTADTPAPAEKGVCPQCGKSGLKRVDVHLRSCKAA